LTQRAVSAYDKPMSRYDKAVARIDEANAADPNLVIVEGVARAAELVYGERMSAVLARLEPEASELLRIAVRAQHIRRWLVPRSDFPLDRPGYHRWRNDLKRRHAAWAGEIMAASGYKEDEIARVGALIRKERLETDAEAQCLEDVACLVFLEHYAESFAGKHGEAKLVGILRKTLGKMSGRGRAAIEGAPVPPAVQVLLARALAAVEPSA
jgi:hypothetical protein